MPITHMPLQRGLLFALLAAALWGAIYYLLDNFTDSTVPALDSFTTALSMVAMWMLARKWVEQWLAWLVVDAVCAVLYFYKSIPFTASLYAFYTVMAVVGYRAWHRRVEKS